MERPRAGELSAPDREDKHRGGENMSDHHDLPFKAEYAKSNRSSCKGCKESINRNSLRLAAMVQSPTFDGKVPNWFHYACFWKRNRVENYQDINNFDALRWEDQQKIKDRVASGSSGREDGAVSGSGSTDFTTEYAKSGRSTCRNCQNKIAKNEIRISKKDFMSVRAKMYGPQEMWHHVDCFVKNREELDFGEDMNVERIGGFGNLKEEDKNVLVEKLGKGTGAGNKRKIEKTAPAEKGKKAKIETAEEKQLKEQSKKIWDIRDKLQKNVSTEALKMLLEMNKQEIPSGESKLLDAVTDCMMFGALDPCPECNNGQLVYKTDGYHCTGNLTSWTKCMYIAKTPKRRAFKIPKEYHDVDVLKKYKYTKNDRVFPAVTIRSTEGPVSSKDTVDGLKPMKPLEHLRFGIIGKTGKSKRELTTEIENMGGQVTNKMDSTVAACISSSDEVKKMGKTMKLAKTADIHIVDENFLDDIKKGGVAMMILKHSIASWGGDPHKRIVEPSVKNTSKSAEYSKRDEMMFTKSVPNKLKMTVKGGAAVDPDSGLTDSAHVIEERGNVYNAVLGLVDIVKGTNSYYKVQALEADEKNSWWLFRSWGRVGTTIGGNKVEKCRSRNVAVENFRTLYAEKTNNEWDNRKNFQKFPNKFFPLEIDYGQDEENVKKLDKTGSKSKLHKSIQELICMIFDIESMKKAMMEFEIDLKKMPLGKLSRKQIESAYSVLSELLQLIENKGSTSQFLDASNRFYTLIPHDFGLKKPPLLDSADVIKLKTEMLENLLEIEVAYSLLKGGDEGKDPIDAHYEKLKTDIEIVENTSAEYKRLEQYVKNTHASTHNQYELEVLEIFKVARHGEFERYQPFCSIGNEKLLWHGSRVTNFAGILSQGLRIAPPEAPVTGYMFGKGVYFADMVSKSANYCHTSKADPVGLLMLCNVALGNMYELTSANYVTSLPKGKHSTKGVGMTMPNPEEKYVSEDGVEIPMGKAVSSNAERSSLLYNEYIVYDVAQINMKYLLKLKYNYKW